MPAIHVWTARLQSKCCQPTCHRARDGTANHRSQFYKDITIPFYGFNRPGAVVSEGIRENWWRQSMMGATKAQYDCIKVLAETEFFDDLKMIDVPVLVMHGEDD